MLEWFGMLLYIVRHAQSANNALLDQRYRVHDPHLTELGQRQAEILARHLAVGPVREPVVDASTGNPTPHGPGYGITRLYCSPMLRALQTAEPVGRALGLAPEVWVDIHECGGVWRDHGENGGIVGYPGIRRPELQEMFPGFTIPENLTDEGWWRDGHEEAHAWNTRAALVADRLRSWAPCDERVAIITHGAFSDCLFHALFGADGTERVYYELYNTSISAVDFGRDGQLSLRYLNRVDHLAPPLVT